MWLLRGEHSNLPRNCNIDPVLNCIWSTTRKPFSTPFHKNFLMFFYCVYTEPRFRGRTREVGQIRLAGFHWPTFTQWSCSGAHPTSAAERMSSSTKCHALHMEKFHTLQGKTRLSVYTHEKSGVRPRMWGRTLQIWSSTKGASDPTSGAGDLCLHQGVKCGSDPACRVRPCNRGPV